MYILCNTMPWHTVCLFFLPISLSSYCCHSKPCYTMPHNSCLFPAVPYLSCRGPLSHTYFQCHTLKWHAFTLLLDPWCHTYFFFCQTKPKINNEWNWEVILYCRLQIHLLLIVWFQQSYLHIWNQNQNETTCIFFCGSNNPTFCKSCETPTHMGAKNTRRRAEIPGCLRFQDTRDRHKVTGLQPGKYWGAHTQSHKQ